MSTAAELELSQELSGAMLRPVGGHAFESCVEQLATAIRLGVYPLNTTLPSERDLAERLGVSRATLREAIAALRSAGLVRTRRGRGGGTAVSHRPGTAAGPLDLERRGTRLRDSLVFRRLVEPGAAYLAASSPLTDEHRDLLTTAHDEVAAAKDAAVHRQADSRFHLLIAAVTNSELTLRAVTDVQAELHDMLSAIPVLEVNIAHSNAQHRAILRAILRGDPTRARRVMENHCDDTAALLRGLLA
ncbi:MAG: FadR/GntR family transcriptional regulator [Nocardioidaceae bacterium]